MTNDTDPIAKLAQLAEQRSKVLREFQQLVEIDRADARALTAQLAGAMGVDLPAPIPEQSTISKVLAYFVATDNAPASKSEIAKALALTEWQLHGAMYGESRGMFISQPNPNGGKSKVFNLTPEALDRARAQSA